MIHSHCDIKTYGSIDSTNVTGSLPADYRPGGNRAGMEVFQFAPLLNEVPPPSTVKNCNYEISDITKIEVKFTFVGTMVWQNFKFGGPTGINIAPPNNITFQSGVTKIFQLEPHVLMTAELGPLDVSMPKGATGFTLFSDNELFNITSASIKLSGNHYYIDSPLSIHLLAFGLILLFKRKYQRFDDVGRR